MAPKGGAHRGHRPSPPPPQKRLFWSASSVRNRHLFVIDAVLAALVPAAAFALRYEGFTLSPDAWRLVLVYTGAAVLIKLALFYSMGLYHGLWRYASLGELERIFVAGGVAGVACIVFGAIVMPEFGLTASRVPLSVLGLDAIATIGAAAAPRLFMRMAGATANRARGGRRRAVVVGAGTAGQAILRESLISDRAAIDIVAFVDDDRSKHGHFLGGVKVCGGVDDLVEVVTTYRADEVIIAIPDARGPLVRAVMDLSELAGVPTRIVPTLREIISGQVSVSKLRRVEIVDLLRRDPIQINLDQVRTLAAGRTVLVTGGAGSIGSELCRQLAELGPECLVVLDHSENGIFAINGELRDRFPRVRIAPVIADIRNPTRLHQVFGKYKPFAVFHAAAHKHVPLMEESVYEAVTNNVIGTRNVVDASLDANVEHFVLISTDKAVRPTSVMGATKRLAERIVRHAAVTENRNFVSVRFGNVLASTGSVVPMFLEQIRAGGPVKVTHPEMRRYFMTIPEAVQLVLQASAIGTGGELFVLDMGEPIKVVDLARDLIRLSGLDEDEIEIVYTGVRPGEKLFEELFLADESVTGTDHPKVMRARHDQLDQADTERLNTLVRHVFASTDDSEVREQLHTLIKDFSREDARNTPLSGAPIAAVPPAKLSTIGGRTTPTPR